MELRAFDIEKGEYVNGWIMYPDGKCEYPQGGYDIGGYTEDEDNFIVQRFTGLVDENGIKVFEGDLLNIFFGDKHNPKGSHKLVEVYFDEDVLQYCVRGGNIINSSFKQSLVGYANPEYNVIRYKKL